MKKSEKNRRQKAIKQREEAITWWGSKCVQCGERDSSKLEFHHKDPTTKIKGLSYMWGHATEEKIWDELGKCELLCKICHAKEGWKNKSRAQHGTRSKYSKGCRCRECTASNTEYEYNRRNS